MDTRVQPDLVIRGGRVVDGSGAEPFAADVAMSAGKIAAVGRVSERGREEIDADGCVVTPGFVDIHTHYDGHITWASRLRPSSNHGVTTVVTGNCGVGFAPCRAEDRERLIRLMEGVEDIPEAVMKAGLPWRWESFEDYLDFVASREYDVDVAVQLAHAPLRVFVMGERGAAREPANERDMQAMQLLARSAIEAGALGFSTSRTLNHRASDGSLTPSLTASWAELISIAHGLKQAGAGVIQFISDFDDIDSEFELVRTLLRESNRPLSLSLLQFPHAPERWRELLDRIEGASAERLPLKAQVCGRPVGLLAGLSLSFHPFSFCPSYLEIAHLPLAQKLEAMREPARRARILAEFPPQSDMPVAPFLTRLDNVFRMGATPNYEPAANDSLESEARAHGMAPAEWVYRVLTEGDGGEILYIPSLNYVDYDRSAMQAMIDHPDTLLGLGDGGAHCGIICDASLQTYMLSHWVKSRGMPLSEAVRRMSSRNAAAVGLRDRGSIAVGQQADINVIDLDRIRLHRPHVVHDLPEGGRRVEQRADGYVATIVRGAVTYRDGEPSGALPGRLVRGTRQPQSRSQSHWAH